MRISTSISEIKLSLVSLVSAVVMLPALAQSQGKSNDILIVSVGESAGYYDVSISAYLITYYGEAADHLQEMLTLTTGYEDVGVDLLAEPLAKTLADAFYDYNGLYNTNYGSNRVRNAISGGYKEVILTPTIHSAETYQTLEALWKQVYDDAPLNNKYFAPEVFYEGCTQLSKLILKNGGTPSILLPFHTDQAIEEFGPALYRVANGVGMEMIPSAYAIEEAGGGSLSSEALGYIYACSMYTKVTGLNAKATGYQPSGIEAADAESYADYAYQTHQAHETQQHYSTSYEGDGAVVYREADLSAAPFNNDLRFMYKGRSTQWRTRDAIQALVNANAATTSSYTELGRLNGTEPLIGSQTHLWHSDDLPLRASAISNRPDQVAFMYVAGSTVGSAQAQELVDLDQPNMIPFAFDWVKGFLTNGVTPTNSSYNTGVGSTRAALGVHSCVDTYFNYIERGWKVIPTVVGLGRLNEAFPNFATSLDGIHMQDKLSYMNAYMMLSSSLGQEFPIPTDLSDFNFYEGTHTVEEITLACQIGHDIVKEHAHLSETADFVPDSDLSIIADSLPDVQLGVAYSHALTATGGSGSYSWEALSELPAGLTLAANGLLSGELTEVIDVANLAFQVTDSNGAFRKVGLKLYAGLPVAQDLTFSLYSLASAEITLPGYTRDPSRVSYVLGTTSNGSLSGTAPDLTYTPNAGLVSAGGDSFTYTMSIDGVELETATVTLTYLPAGVAAVGGSNYDLTGAEAVSFRSTGVAKSLDLDSDDVYGSSGYYFIGNGVDNTSHSDGTPSWVSAVSHGNTVVGAGYADFDNPTLIADSAVEDWIATGIITNRNDSPGDWEELMTFTIETGAPSHFRLGLFSGVEGNSDGRWDPSGLRVVFNGETAEVTNLEITDLGVVFFDVTVPNGFTGSLQIEGQTRSAGGNSRGPSLTGVVFDALLTGYEQYLNDYALSQSGANDADSDSVSGLMEYVLNGDPTVNDGAEIMPTLTEQGGAREFRFIRRKESATDTTQVVQYSHDLITWTDMPVTGEALSAEVTVSPNTNNVLEDVSVETSSIEEDGMVFMRLKVIEN